MGINKISDIKLNKEYYLLLTKDKRMAKKCLIKMIGNDKRYDGDKTEVLYEKFDNSQKRSFIGAGILNFTQLGIGETIEEAYVNFGRFKYEDHPDFSDLLEVPREARL